MPERVEPPKTPKPEADPVLEEAVEALASTEVDSTIQFGDGLSLNPLQLNGLDERRVRVASDGQFPTLTALMQAAGEQSIEAIGALYYITRLKADGLVAKADSASYTYEDCIEALDLESITEMFSGVDAVDPT